MELSGSEMVLLIALVAVAALLGALLVWERVSGNRERTSLRQDAEERIARLMTEHGRRDRDLFNRLTLALGRPLPPPELIEIRNEPRTWDNGADRPVSLDAPPDGVHPSMALSDDQQELAIRMQAQGKSHDEIWRALMQMQPQ